jgi:hypothetical protein
MSRSSTRGCQSGLGVEAVERFVADEPLWRVHQAFLGLLAVESEPVDPRLLRNHQHQHHAHSLHADLTHAT